MGLSPRQWLPMFPSAAASPDLEANSFPGHSSTYVTEKSEDKFFPQNDLYQKW